MLMGVNFMAEDDPERITWLPYVRNILVLVKPEISWIPIETCIHRTESGI